MVHETRMTWLVGLTGLALAIADPPTTPADFKLVVESFAAGKEAIGRVEWLARGGRVYQAERGAREILIVDRDAGRCELLDLRGKRRARVSFQRLDEYLARVRAGVVARAERLEAAGGKSNREQARMARDVVTPNLQSSFDRSRGHLRSFNGSIQADALGVAEPDTRRLALIADATQALVKLESLREPKAIPPFVRLEVLNALIVQDKLRPAQLEVLYRLAGPPVRARWTYRLVPELTAAEQGAIDEVDRLRAEATLLSFEGYRARLREAVPSKDPRNTQDRRE